MSKHLRKFVLTVAGGALVVSLTACSSSDEADGNQSKSGIPVITCTDNARQVDLYNTSGELTDSYFFPLGKDMETLANCTEKLPPAALRYYFSNDYGLMTVRQENVTGRWSTGVIKATEPGKKAEFIDFSGDLSRTQSAGVFDEDGKKIIFYQAPFEKATTEELNGEFPEPTIPADVMSVNVDDIASKDLRATRYSGKIEVYDTDENERPIVEPATVNSLIYRLPNGDDLEGTSDPDKVYLPDGAYDDKYMSFGFWAKEDDAIIRGDVRAPGRNAESIPLAKQGDGYDSIDPVVPFDTERLLGYGAQGSLYDVSIDPTVGMQLTKLDLGLSSKYGIVEPVPGTDKQSFVFVTQHLETGARVLYSATLGTFGTQPKVTKLAKLPAKNMKSDATNVVAVMAVS